MLNISSEINFRRRKVGYMTKYINCKRSIERNSHGSVLARKRILAAQQFFYRMPAAILVLGNVSPLPPLFLGSMRQGSSLGQVCIQYVDSALWCDQVIMHCVLCSAGPCEGLLAAVVLWWGPNVIIYEVIYVHH